MLQIKNTNILVNPSDILSFIDICQTISYKGVPEFAREVLRITNPERLALFQFLVKKRVVELSLHDLENHDCGNPIVKSIERWISISNCSIHEDTLLELNKELLKIYISKLKYVNLIQYLKQEWTSMCLDGCCSIKHTGYYGSPVTWLTNSTSKRSGALLYDQIENKILLVQSRGRMWGPPKGGTEDGETVQEGAIREVMEETGLDITNGDFSKYTICHGKCTYYLMNHPVCDVNVQNKNHLFENDANSITWIKPECLKKMENSKKMKLTSQCKMVLNHFF